MAQSIYDALCHFPEPTLTIKDVNAITINKEWEKAYDKKEARRIRRKQGRQERRIKKYGRYAHFSISAIEDTIERLCNQQRYDNPDARAFTITTGAQDATAIANAMRQQYNETLW
jgi:hypothetical protein